MDYKEIEGYIVRLQRIQIHCCEKCPKAFTAEEQLNKHYERHDLEQKLFKEKLLEHMKSCKVLLNRVSMYRCSKCTKGFLNYLALNAHQKEHSKTLKRKAEIEWNNNELKQHSCEECGLRFVAGSTLDTHLKVHKPYPHVCHCGIGFRIEKDLAIHVRLVHPTTKPWLPKSKYTGTKIKSEFILQHKTSNLEKDEKALYDTTFEVKIKKKPAAKIKVGQSKVQKKAINKTKTSRTYKANLHSYENDDGSFTCFFCDEINSAESVSSHMKLHVQESKLYTCDQCLRTYKTEAYLIVHKKTHVAGNNNIWKCDRCRAVLKNMFGLRTHMLIHTEEKRFTCHLCPIKFVQQGSLKLHLKVHSNTYIYKCEYCKKQLRTKDALKLHLRTHTGERPYACSNCDKRFADPSAFQRHKRTHTGEKPYQCAFCPKAFSDRSAHIVHERRHRGVTFTCTLCNRKLSTYASLYKHMTLHKNTTFYQCDHCIKKCRFKNNLRQHIEASHTKLNNYVCKYCQKKYVNKESLNTHVLKIHTSPAYSCEICNMKFKVEGDKNTHITNIHLCKELKFECNYCNARFNMKYRLTEHMVLVHNFHHECRYCKVHHDTLDELRKHQCGYIEPKALKSEYICDHCDENFTGIKGKHHLRNHIWTVHMIRMFCDKCMKCFYSEYALTHHKKTDCKKIIM